MLLRQIRRLSKGRPGQVSGEPRIEALGSSAQGQEPAPALTAHTARVMGEHEGHRTPPSSCYHPTPSLLSPYYSDGDLQRKGGVA